MPRPAFGRLLEAARTHLLARGARPVPDAGRRTFFRRAGAGALGVVGTGLLLPDDAWAATAERAAAFGITPGTVVDARGRPVEARGAEPFLGEIMMCGWNFAARGWALCDGQVMAISANSALFSLLGTIYGGDGRTTFALPDLRGRFPTQFGSGPGLTTHDIGQRGGTESVTLTTAQMPTHQHTLTPQPVAAAVGTLRSPVGNVPAADPEGELTYAPPSAGSGTFGGAEAVTAMTGGSQSMSIMPPFLAINFQIALQGVFPSRS